MSRNTGKFTVVWDTPSADHVVVECQDCKNRFNRPLNTLATCKNCGNEEPPVSRTVPEVSGSAVKGKPEMVVHPKHYNNLGALCHHCGGDIECIDVVEKMSFNIGSAVKYLWRVDEKYDNVEDLQKAKFYIEREISTREKKNSDVNS